VSPAGTTQPCTASHALKTKQPWPVPEFCRKVAVLPLLYPGGRVRQSRSGDRRTDGCTQTFPESGFEQNRVVRR
jgi:hypothetical protein